MYLLWLFNLVFKEIKKMMNRKELMVGVVYQRPIRGRAVEKKVPLEQFFISEYLISLI